MREFLDYYKAQHADHPDVRLWERYYLEYIFRHMPIPNMPYRRSGVENIAHMRENWQQLSDW